MKDEHNNIYNGRKCFRCGRQHNFNTVLNIEGFIHHGLSMVCLDSKSCRRKQRKMKKHRKHAN